jgi:hypothetical protein
MEKFSTSRNEARRKAWERDPRLPRSGVRGVYMRSGQSGKPYYSQRSIGGKSRWLGNFATIEEAAEAFRNA